MPTVSSTAFIQKSVAGLVLWCCLSFLPTIVHAAATSSATLQWAANTESDLAGYKLYQGTTTASYGLPIDVGNVTTHTTASLQAGLTYYFAVTAYDTAGNESSPSAEVSKYVEDSLVDVTPPSIALTSPNNGTTLSGSATISAIATDNIGVAGVQFQLNGTNLGEEDATAPYTVLWDTDGKAPGQYTLTAIARDAAENYTSSDPVPVTLASSSSTLSVSIVGNGSVSSNLTGVHCTSGTCSTSYQMNSTVTLVAQAGKRWKFSGWSGACTGIGECVIQLSTDQFVTATFSKGGSGNNKGGGKGGGRKK